MRALKPGGRLVRLRRRPRAPTVELNLPRLFFKQFEIIGSTMGSYQEFAEVTALVANGLPVDRRRGLPARPTTRRPSLASRSGSQLGKIVLQPLTAQLGPVSTQVSRGCSVHRRGRGGAVV